MRCGGKVGDEPKAIHPESNSIHLKVGDVIESFIVETWRGHGRNDRGLTAVAAPLDVGRPSTSD